DQPALYAAIRGFLFRQKHSVLSTLSHATNNFFGSNTRSENQRDEFSKSLSPESDESAQESNLFMLICIFLLTMQHEYLNILYVSFQRYNSLGFKKVRSGSKATKSS